GLAATAHYRQVAEGMGGREANVQEVVWGQYQTLKIISNETGIPIDMLVRGEILPPLTRLRQLRSEIAPGTISGHPDVRQQAARLTAAKAAEATRGRGQKGRGGKAKSPADYLPARAAPDRGGGAGAESALGGEDLTPSKIEQREFEEYPAIDQTIKDPVALDKAIEKVQDVGPSTVSDTGEEETIEMGMNKAQVTHLLGEHAYKKSIVEVCVKELLQNSLDSSRAAGSTYENPMQIHIDLDNDERSITVTDTGTGMDKQTLKDAFFTIGGTKKPTNPTETS